MRTIPKKQRNEMEQQPFFRVCALAGYNHGKCEGSLTWDHPLTFGGPQIIDPNFTVPLCAKHHNVNDHLDGKSYKKELSIWVALNRATDAEIVKYSKAVNYRIVKTYLNGLYGQYDEAKAIAAYIPSKSPHSSTLGRIKPNWVPISPTHKKWIKECIDYYADVHGKFYTEFEMVEKMIASCRAALPIKSDDYVKDNSNRKA